MWKWEISNGETNQEDVITYTVPSSIHSIKYASGTYYAPDPDIGGTHNSNQHVLCQGGDQQIHKQSLYIVVSAEIGGNTGYA